MPSQSFRFARTREEAETSRWRSRAIRYRQGPCASSAGRNSSATTRRPTTSSRVLPQLPLRPLVGCGHAAPHCPLGRTLLLAECVRRQIKRVQLFTRWIGYSHGRQPGSNLNFVPLAPQSCRRPDMRKKKGRPAIRQTVACRPNVDMIIGTRIIRSIANAAVYRDCRRGIERITFARGMLINTREAGVISWALPL